MHMRIAKALWRSVFQHAVVIVVLWLLLILALFFFARPAGAHSWFSAACCSGRDCSPAGVGMVTWTMAGWSVQRTNEVVPFTDPRIQYVPPGELQQFYLCVPPGTTRLRCLYVPESAG